MRRALLTMLAALSVSAFAPQAAIPAAAPVDVDGAGGFTLRAMPGRPGIDGRAWMLVDVQTGQTSVVTPAGAGYALRFSDADRSGEIPRWSVTLERAGSAPVPLTAGGKTAFVYVTPDGRYVITEPLLVLDTRTWRRYALHRVFGIEPFVTIRAATRDGRLFIERRNCAVTCADRPAVEEYFELGLPPS